MRKDGISALFASQNSEKTIVACITSFLEFADEVIIVDNGSTDNTIKICRALASKYKKVQFFDHPEIVHLYENRQIALEHSTHKWIFRGDTDYVACDNILELRNLILKTSTKHSPVVFHLKQVNLIHDIHHTKYKNPVGGLMPRIYSYSNRMQFQRLGRWEGIKYFNDVVNLRINRPVVVVMKKPYWFHCQFKEPIDYMFRSERTNWRELGDFKKFPTLEPYMKKRARYRFGTNDLDKACEIYMEKCFWPRLLEYDPEKYVAYSTHILKNFK